MTEIGSNGAGGLPSPELVERAARRRYSAEYKLRIVQEAEACEKPGEVGALLRREGLYTSHLTYWRKQRDAGALQALGRPRGRKPADRRRRGDRRVASSRGAGRGGAREGPQSDRDSGKRLSALGADARYWGREREHRAMICQTVDELTPIVGTRPACRAVRAAPATVYRRRNPPAPRPPRPRPAPPRALSDSEREAVLELLHSERFVDCSPAQVWATLLDEGIYLASERTMYPLLDVNGEVRERRDQLAHPAYAKPELLAERPNEVWSWDISKLKGPAKWTCFYLYAILDVFSRYVVAWTVQYREDSKVAKALIAQACEQQQITPEQLILHADRGSSMTSKPVATLLADLGVTKTHSRPYTSSDNPYSEAHFKTLKHRPEFPDRFDNIEQARDFCRQFFDWYNHQHRHSGIALMTPAAVHDGRAQQLHEHRARVLAEAFQRTPERFVRKLPVPPALPTAVWINKPENEEAAH